MSAAAAAAIELAPNLWRWTAPHPGWTPDPEPESPADWDREVGSVLHVTGGAAVFIDALLPEDEDGFWRWADPITERCERVLALTTIGFHRRDRDRLVDRYGASTSRAARELPAGVLPVALRGAGEVVFWLDQPRALVCGDRLLGDGQAALRTCPASWLRYLESGIDEAALSERLRPLLELPVEMVLVSHGDPVLSGGRDAIAGAIA